MENTRLELEKLTGCEEYKRFKTTQESKARNGGFSKSLADIVLSSDDENEHNVSQLDQR